MERPDRLKVLLIEDDEDDYILVKGLLSDALSWGFDLDWVQTYEAGLEDMCHSGHDVYLLDYRLGERNGLELMREAVKKGCEVPVIVLTGQGGYEVDMEAMKAGAADYLVKGQIGADLLARSIRYSIAHKRTEYELRSYRDHLEELAEERTAQLEAANERLQAEIEEKIQVEEALIKSEEKNRMLVDSSLDLIYSISPDGLITSLNPAFEEITGWSSSEWIGKHFEPLISRGDLPAFSNRLDKLLRGRVVPSGEFHIRSKSGGYRILELKSVPVVEKSRVVGIMGTARDVTDRKLAEEKIAQQNVFLKTVIESLSHPFFVLDANDYTIKMANVAAAPGGLPAGTTCYAMSHTESLPCGGFEHIHLVKRIKESKRSVTKEHIHYDENGNARHFEVHAHPIFDSMGNVVQIIEYTLDITERKRMDEEVRKARDELEIRVRERTAELETANEKLKFEIEEHRLADAALKESKEFLEKIINSIADPLFVKDSEHRLVLVNEALCRLVGVGSKDLVGKTGYDFFAKEQVDAFWKSDEAVLKTGKQSQSEEEVTDRQGRKGTFFAKKSLYTDNSESRFVVGIMTDITERKSMEESLRMDELRLEALLELSQMSKASDREIADFVLKQTVRLTQSGLGALGFLNEDETILTLHAWSKEIQEQSTLKKDTDGLVRIAMEEAGSWAKSVRERKPMIINDYPASNLKDKERSGFSLELSRFMGVPVFDGDRIAAMALLGNKEAEYDDSDLRQVTLLMDGMWKVIQRRQAEKAFRESENLATMGKALAGLAHDIKTPLVAIGGFTKLAHRHMEEGNPDRDKLEIVIRETGRLEKMVKDMLDFSRPLELDRSMADIGRVIEESLMVVQGTAGERKVKVAVELAQDLPLISLDSMRMKQVIINLVMNAIQASPQVDVVKVSARQKRGHVLIDIVDRGSGIALDKREEIFLPFISTKKEGTGLGLPIVKKIVEAHQGCVKILDNPEKGVTFRVMIPVVL